MIDGTSQLVKTLAVNDRSDPGAASKIIVAGSDFEWTSPKFFLPRNPSVSAAWSRIDPDVDPGGGNEIGDAL